MARFRKFRSTTEGREYAYKAFCEALSAAVHETPEQIAQRLTQARSYQVEVGDKSREDLLVMLATDLARRIINA